MSDDLSNDINSLVSTDDDVIPIATSSTVSTDATPSSYTPDRLKRLLQHEKHKFRILKNESPKPLASWWRTFGYPALLNEKNEFQRIPGFISCFKCSHTSNYGPKSGTRRFIEHADRCSPVTTISDQRPTQSSLDKNIYKQKVSLTSKEENELKELYAKWICRDIRPFSIVEDDGFRDLAQMFVRIGAQHGLIDVKEVLRSRQTVARTVNDLAIRYRHDLKDELIEPLKAKSVTICPDFWCNKYTQQSFLGLNVTFVDAEHAFKCIDLLCIPFNGTKSYDSILEILRRCLSEYGITELSQVNIISDRGANFVKAFALYQPLYCFGHRLNNVLKVCFFQHQHTKKTSNVSSMKNDSTQAARQTTADVNTPGDDALSDSESDSSEEDENDQDSSLTDEDTLVEFQRKKLLKTTASQKMSINDIPAGAKKVILLLKRTKKLVKYVKQAGLNPEIKAAGGTTLHQASIVRWLTLSNLLESVINSFKVTKRVLISKQKQHLINDLNEQTLKQLVVLLKPFKNMMTIIQRGNAPSLHLVSLCYITLKELLSSYELLKQYNKDNDDDDNKEQSAMNSHDDDLEHELPGAHVESKFPAELLFVLEVKWFRERLLLLLKEMFVLDIRHVVATLLHPHYRSLKKFPDHVKTQCHRYIRRQIRQLREEAEIEIQLQQKSSEPTAKRFKGAKNLFSRFESENIDEDINQDENSSGSEEFEYHLKKSDELDRYLLFEFEKTEQTENPLEFWKNHRNQFPYLAQYARTIFSIPATTTNVEREFSTAGWILNQRRTNLKPEEVDKILFIRSIEKQLEKK